MLISVAIANDEKDEDYADALVAAKRQDFAYALELWNELADGGHSNSQYKLGVLYRLGYGVKKDFQKAFHRFEQAAQQAHGYAQYNLAMMYLKGWGTKRNTNEAEKWLRKASIHKIRLAQEKLDSIIADSLSTIDRRKVEDKDGKPDVDINEILIWAAKDGRAAAISDLIDLGAEVNWQNKFGRSALMEAAYSGRPLAVEMLLDLGADVNAKDKVLIAKNLTVRLVEQNH